MMQKQKKLLAYLLIIGLGIILIQVALGGLTRLTGSGLSMTDWNLIMGAFPPITDAQWLVEFDEYKASPQYQKLNKGMDMASFKFIYFWEYTHRVWGRFGFLFLMGILTFFGFKQLTSQGKGWLDWRNFWLFGALLILYALQGLLGWWMVKSGLVDNPYVSHYRLASHLILAISLFAFMLWWVVQLLVPKENRIRAEGFKFFAWLSTAVIVLQIVFGAFMSGLKIAGRYPSWPDMNGQIIPEGLFYLSPFWKNFLENAATIQFTHRGLAYLLLGLLLYYFFKSRKFVVSESFAKARIVLPIVLLLQVALGIFTVINASGDTVPIILGAAHQLMGLVLLSTVLFLNFQLD